MTVSGYASTVSLSTMALFFLSFVEATAAGLPFGFEHDKSPSQYNYCSESKERPHY